MSPKEVYEAPINEKARLHSLFQISNSAKDHILDEMHKWSYKDGDLGVTRDLNKNNLPMEPLVEEYEHDELNDSFWVHTAEKAFIQFIWPDDVFFCG